MSQISVQITADVADLTAKLAVAKAEVQSANTELRAMAQQMAAAGNAASAELKSGLAASAQAAATARAELSALNTQLKETQASSGGLAGSFVGMRESIESTMAPIGALNSLITTFSEVFLVAFAGERIISGIEHIAELGANLVKLHEQTGIAVETLSGLHYAAEQADVSAESLDSGIKKLGKSIQEALKNPASNAAEAFRAMGFTTEELRAHSNDLLFVFMKMADAFHDHSAGAQADAIAMATLGRGGVEMIPILQQGSEEIQAQIKHQKDLGSQMTGPMAQAMREHVQAVKKMGEAWSKFGIEITSMVAGPGTTLAHWLTGLAKGMEALKQKLAEKMGVVIDAPLAGDLAGSRSWPKVPTPKAKPDFGNIGDDGAKDASKIKEISDAELNADLTKRNAMSKFDQAYFAMVEKESKDLSAEIVKDSEKTAADLKTYADNNFQNFKLSIDGQKDAAKGNFDEQLRLDQQLIDRAKALYGQDSTNFREAMKTRFADLKGQIDQQMQPWNNLVHGIGNSFNTMFNGILQGTQTFRQMMAHLGDSLIATFAQVGIKIAEDWALNQIRQVLSTQQAQVQQTGSVAAGEASRNALKVAGAAEGKAVDAAAGSASVMGDAYKAAAGTYAALAGIPYIGPFIAPVAAAASFVAVEAFDVFSAASGFDVGPGQTPLTQLHPREMVLPAGLAEVIRGIDRSGGSGGGAGPNVTFNQHNVFGSGMSRDEFNRSTRQLAEQSARAIKGHLEKV